MALDTLAGEAELLQLEGNTDVVDAALETGDGTALRSVQAKTRVEPYVWRARELAGVISEWVAGPPSDGERFDFVTDGHLGPSVVDELVPALRRIADGTASADDESYLSDLGLDPSNPHLARIVVHSRLPGGRHLLEEATLRLVALRERSDPLTVPEARNTVKALFGELVLGSGGRDREHRRLDRQHIAELVGVPLEAIDDAAVWAPEVEERYRNAIAAKEQDPAWTMLDLLAAERPAALTFVRSRDDEESEPFQATELLDRSGSALLEGPAGVGKTTTLAQLSFEAVERGLVPIPVRFASYAAGALTHVIHQSLERALGLPLVPGTVDLLLARSSTVVLIDGAGELIPEQRQTLILDMQGLRARHEEGARFILAARQRLPFAALTLSGFYVQGLTAERRRHIAAALGPDSEAHTEWIETQLGTVADNPLLFTMAIALRQRGLDAGTRSEVFAGFVEGLQAREEGRPLSAEALAAAQVACLELRSSGRYNADEWWWLETIASARERQVARGQLATDSSAASDMLGELLDVGLVRRLGTSSEFGLLHDLFSDWFAAEAIRKGLGTVADPVPEHLEESVIFLAEQGAVSDGALRALAASPIAAGKAADFLPAAPLDPALVAELWQRLCGLLGPVLRERYAGLELSIDGHAGMVRVVERRSREDPLGAERTKLSCLPRSPRSSLSVAVDLWLAALRLAFQERAPERPTVPAEHDSALADQLAEASQRKLDATRALVMALVPELHDRVMAAIGPLGLRGWLLPAQDVPGVPGSGQVLREHALRYALVDEDASVSVVSDEAEIPVDRENLGIMGAEYFLREAPSAASRKLVRAALSELVPRFDG